MKNVLIIFFTIVLSSKITHAKVCDSGVSKKLVASVFYHDKKHDLSINLGKIFIENAKLIFEQNTSDNLEKGVLVKDDGKKVSVDKIIEEYKRDQLIKVKIRKELLTALEQEVASINSNDGFYPDLQSKYLDIETRKIFYQELKSVIIKICDNNFGKALIRNFYVKYDVLIIPEDKLLSE